VSCSTSRRGVLAFVLLLICASTAVLGLAPSAAASTTTMSTPGFGYDATLNNAPARLAGRAVVTSAQFGRVTELGGSASPTGVGVATETGSTVNLSTAGRSAEEAAAINQYASRSNAWLAENGPQTIRSTDGALRAEASAAARAERLAAARSGTPYSGQAGHVPDTAITGQASPPAGWLDMPGTSNQVCGGVLGSRLGQVISGFTVDGATPC